MNIKVEKQEKNIAIAYRFTTTRMKLAKSINKIIIEISEYVKNNNGTIIGSPFVAYYNNEKQLDVAIGMLIKDKIEENDIYKIIDTNEGNAVTAIHEGSYIWLGRTYRKMTKYINDNKLTPINLAYEYYCNSPKAVKRKELKTKVVLYIK